MVSLKEIREKNRRDAENQVHAEEEARRAEFEKKRMKPKVPPIMRPVMPKKLKPLLTPAEAEGMSYLDRLRSSADRKMVITFGLETGHSPEAIARKMIEIHPIAIEELTRYYCSDCAPLSAEEIKNLNPHEYALYQHYQKFELEKARMPREMRLLVERVLERGIINEQYRAKAIEDRESIMLDPIPKPTVPNKTMMPRTKTVRLPAAINSITSQKEELERPLQEQLILQKQQAKQERVEKKDQKHDAVRKEIFDIFKESQLYFHPEIRHFYQTGFVTDEMRNNIIEAHRVGVNNSTISNKFRVRIDKVNEVVDQYELRQASSLTGIQKASLDRIQKNVIAAFILGVPEKAIAEENNILEKQAQEILNDYKRLPIWLRKQYAKEYEFILTPYKKGKTIYEIAEMRINEDDKNSTLSLERVREVARQYERNKTLLPEVKSIPSKQGSGSSLEDQVRNHYFNTLPNDRSALLGMAHDLGIPMTPALQHSLLSTIKKKLWDSFERDMWFSNGRPADAYLPKQKEETIDIFGDYKLFGNIALRNQLKYLTEPQLAQILMRDFGLLPKDAKGWGKPAAVTLIILLTNIRVHPLNNKIDRSDARLIQSRLWQIEQSKRNILLLYAKMDRYKKAKKLTDADEDIRLEQAKQKVLQNQIQIINARHLR